MLLLRICTYPRINLASVIVGVSHHTKSKFTSKQFSKPNKKTKLKPRYVVQCIRVVSCIINPQGKNSETLSLARREEEHIPNKQESQS